MATKRKVNVTHIGSGQASSNPWTNDPTVPGLYIMRFFVDFHHDRKRLTLVRLVMIDDGTVPRREFYDVNYANELLKIYDFDTPEFQKVGE